MLPQGYVALVLLWSAYCCVHSALISLRVTNFFRRILGPGFRFYRLGFNVFSIGTLVPLAEYSDRWQGPVVFAWGGYLRAIQWPLLVLAASLVIAGARHYSMLQFLGIRQLRGESSCGAMTQTGTFDSTGVLGLMRHPWYVAVFIFLWARELTAADIAVNLVLSAYLVVGTVLEERKLVQEFGDEYRDYQRRVSMFIPLKWHRLPVRTPNRES